MKGLREGFPVEVTPGLRSDGGEGVEWIKKGGMKGCQGHRP